MEAIEFEKTAVETHNYQFHILEDDIAEFIEYLRKNKISVEHGLINRFWEYDDDYVSQLKEKVSEITIYGVTYSTKDMNADMLEHLLDVQYEKSTHKYNGI